MLLLSSTSCSLGKKDNNNISNLTAEQIMEKAYQAVKIECELPFHSINSISSVNASEKILINGNDNEMYLTDTGFTDFKPIRFKKYDGNVEYYYHTAFSDNDIIYVLESLVDYGNFQIPDFNDPDFDYENFDFEAMEKAANISFTIYSIDEEGNILTEMPVKGLEEYIAKTDDITYDFLSDLILLGDDSLVVTIKSDIGELHALIDANSGELGKKIEFGTDDNFFPLICNDVNNNIVFISDRDIVSELKTIDAGSKQLSPDVISLNDIHQKIAFVIKGVNEYIIYFSDYASLYGITSDGKVEELINWSDSQINGENIEFVIPLENNEFIVIERDSFSNSSYAYLLTKRDSSETANIQIINLAVDNYDDTLVEKVKQFNMLNSEYYIKVENYNKYYTWDNNDLVNSPEKQLQQDIALGKKIDIICLNGNSSIFNNLANKDVLVDLYDYLGTDDTVKKEDLVQNIIKIGEVNGKLYSISPSYNVGTYALKTKYCNKENWNINDLINVYQSVPEGMYLFKSGNSKEIVLNMLLYGNVDFIDYEKASCQFDSSDFIKLLEFSDTFVNDSSTSEDTDMLCHDDKALLDYFTLNDIKEYAHERYAKFGEDITLVGVPSSNGRGAIVSANKRFSIMSTSNCKEESWKFISKFFEKDYQMSEDVYTFSIPALKLAFSQKLDESMQKPYYINKETGVKTEYDDYCYLNGEKVTVPPLSKKERDNIEKYITSIDLNGYYFDDDILNIINEEAAPFFAGEKSVEETAKIIQNRISIILSEQS